MGESRNIINDEFKDKEEIDTEEEEKHKSKNFKRKRKEMKKKVKKFKSGLSKRLWIMKKNLLLYRLSF